MEGQKRYVQHISGQGEKWEVTNLSYNNKEEHSDWQVTPESNPGALFEYHYLPKSEYRLCEPPERWVDVTGECDVTQQSFYPNMARRLMLVHDDDFVSALRGYRLRKVQLWSKYEGREEYKDQWAFIIEKKVTE